MKIDSIELMDPPRLSFYTKEGSLYNFFHNTSILNKNYYTYPQSLRMNLLFSEMDRRVDKTFFGKNRKNKSHYDIESHESYVGHHEERITVYQITKKNGEIIKWVRNIETILDHSLTMKIDDLNLLLSRLEKN